MPGGSLQSLYKTIGKLSETQIKNYIKNILKGLAYLHENKVIHCDLKGANVLIDSQGVAKLSDFGCAKLLQNSIS